MCTSLLVWFFLLLPCWVIHLNRPIFIRFSIIPHFHLKFNLQWAVISYKLPLLVLWVAFFSTPVPSNSRALHSHDSLFWQEFHTPDGPSITWLQTSPFKCAEPSLRNPIKALDNNLPQFPPPHLHSRLPTGPSEPLGLSQSFSVLVRKAQRDPWRRGPCVFTTARLNTGSSLLALLCPPLNAQDKKNLWGSGVNVSQSIPPKPHKYYVSILVDLLNRLTTAVQR